MRKITVSSDKHKFGVQLRAEPNNQALGRRLKGAFKQVLQAIKGTQYQNYFFIGHLCSLFARIGGNFIVR